MMKFTLDFKMLINDAREKIDEHIKGSGERLASPLSPLLLKFLTNPHL
jgi:hypothetical protein